MLRFTFPCILNLRNGFIYCNRSMGIHTWDHRDHQTERSGGEKYLWTPGLVLTVCTFQLASMYERRILPRIWDRKL